MKAARRRRRAESIKRRVISSIDNYMPRCAVFGCGQPTQRASKQGLSPFLCRKHVLHRQRHGSSWCPSPKGKVLRPYRLAAEIFIKKYSQDLYVASALVGMQCLMRDAGEVIRAT